MTLLLVQWVLRKAIQYSQQKSVFILLLDTQRVDVNIFSRFSKYLLLSDIRTNPGFQ